MKRFFRYLFAWVALCILLLYALIEFAKVAVAYIFNGIYAQLTPPFLLSCTLAYFGAVVLAIIYLVHRFKSKTQDDSYLKLNYKNADGTTGYIYTSNGKVLFDTNIVLFEISSAEGFELWNGSQFVDATIQDMYVTKDKKVYARLKRNNV